VPRQSAQPSNAHTVFLFYMFSASNKRKKYEKVLIIGQEKAVAFFKA
jgi:hypothetical protein